MNDLIPYGYPKELVEIWKQEESEQLLPIQEVAIQEYNVFDKSSGNLLVIAPTSSGKTFIGELAAAKEALEMRRTIYLVPFRAIAEEIYVNFVRKYKGFGLRVVISNRDHREYDDDIINGEYEIAIVVYEKLTGLLTKSPGLLLGCGLIVADEVQMMGDENRGPTIELLLTKVLLSTEKVRIIALSAVLDKLNDFDKWLRSRILKSTVRPVELREGIYLSDGRVQYKEFNTCKQGTEKLKKWELVREGLLYLVQACIDREEQVLIFCSTRRSTVETANMLATELSNTSPAIDTIRRANDLIDSATREQLQRILQGSVAYHNSDLALDERLLVEEGFRRRDIKAIACTSTLAMGVNVPARNVIVYEPVKWIRGRANPIPISVAEYKNMTGRAGRYSTGDPYGRSYLIASSPARAATYDSNYINGALEDFTSSFGDRAIDEQVLEIVAGGLSKTSEEISRFVFSTYNGQHKWTTDEKKGEIDEMISRAIEKCLEHEAVVTDDNGNLSATESGKLCASGGYLLTYLRSALNYLNRYKTDVDISIIYWALQTDDGLNAYQIPRLRGYEFNSKRYQQILDRLTSEISVGQLLDELAADTEDMDYEECVTLRRCLACYAWISEKPTRQIEADFPGVGIGAIRNTALVCEWLVSFLADLADIVEENSERSNALKELADRLFHGATRDSLGLARIRGSGLSRDERNHLVKNDIQTIDDVLACQPDKIPLPKNKVIKLIRAAESNIKDSLERRKRYQLTRLRSLNVNTSILNNIYEKEGNHLEIAIDDLFKKPFIKLTCQRITRQKEGEPDHLLYDSSGNIFAIQTTAREKKNISMKKAASVIGQSAKYKPSGYIVFGRPDFEVLAIENAEDQLRAGVNYKLIPIPVLAEMYVLVNEKRMTCEDIEKILIDWKGYVNLERIYDYSKD